MLDAVTLALHAAVLESAKLQVTCLRFGTIVIIRSLLLRSMGVSFSKLAVGSFLVKVELDFFKWREQFEIFSLKIDETWHMCFLGDSGNI